ncbi:hypothetical protein SMX26_001915 [Cronobacter universalis]|nr:hypothetical protein [Cronobacter universalis]
MRLTLNDVKEIEQIIAALDATDNERISDEVERLAKKANPFISALSAMDADEHTADAINYLEGHSIAFQDASEGWWFDALTERVTAEYAISVFKARHSHREAA